jgi:hypothetical protein
MMRSAVNHREDSPLAQVIIQLFLWSPFISAGIALCLQAPR